jgi:hypothetical protein
MAKSQKSAFVHQSFDWFKSNRKDFKFFAQITTKLAYVALWKEGKSL